MSESEIIKAYWEIPALTRTRIQEELKIKPVRETDIYLDAMCHLLGEQIDLCSRERRFVDAKKVLTYILHKRGYNKVEIGRVTGKNHATIYYYIDELDFALERDLNYSTTQLYKKYQKLLEENEIH